MSHPLGSGGKTAEAYTAAVSAILGKEPELFLTWFANMAKGGSLNDIQPRLNEIRARRASKSEPAPKA